MSDGKKPSDSKRDEGVDRRSFLKKSGKVAAAAPAAAVLLKLAETPAVAAEPSSEPPTEEGPEQLD